MIKFKMCDHREEVYTITRKGMKGFFSPKPQGQLLATLNKHLSFEKQGKAFMANPAWALVRLYKFETGSFPWGLWSKVRKILEKNEEVNGDLWTCFHNGKNVWQIKPRDKTHLRSYQDEAIHQLFLNDGGVLCMPTGSGKTFTCLEFLRVIDKVATVVVHTRDLKKQWEDEAEKLGVAIKVTTYQSPLAAEIIKLNPVVVFDECHHVAARTVYQLAGKCREDQIRVGLSATPWREDGCDLLIEAALGPVVYKVERRDLIKEGFLVNARVHYLAPEFEKTMPLSYQEEYEKHVVLNDSRNALIAGTAEKLAVMGKRVLVLVNHVQQGYEILRHYAMFSRPDLPQMEFVHGEIKDRLTPIQAAQVIVASQVFNEGVDFPELDALILAGGGKSSIRVTQQVGRVLRQRLGKPDALVFDFVDKPKHLARHYRLRRKLLEEEFEVSDGW